jgi:hypothetical protein
MLDELYQPALVARAGAGNVGLIMRTRWPYRSVAPNSEDDLAVKSHYGRASVWAPVRAPLKRHRQRPRAQKEEADRNTCCRGIHRSSHDHHSSQLPRPYRVQSDAFGLYRYVQDDLRRGAFARHREVYAQPHRSHLPSMSSFLFRRSHQPKQFSSGGAGPDASGGVTDAYAAGMPDRTRAARVEDVHRLATEMPHVTVTGNQGQPGLPGRRQVLHLLQEPSTRRGRPG